MSKQRPAPELIAAQKWEIKRRYARKRGPVGKRTRSMAAIRLAELTRWLDDDIGAGVELDPSEQSIQITRIFAHHMGQLPEMPRRIKAWVDRYAPWLDLASQERLISEVAGKPLKWGARTLGWKLGLTDADRTRLKITTIAPIDVTDEQIKQRRKAKQAELQRARRARLKAARVNTI